MKTHRSTEPLLPHSQEPDDIVYVGETIAFFASKKHDAHEMERWVGKARTHAGALADWHWGWHEERPGAFIVCIGSEKDKQRLYAMLESAGTMPKGTLRPLGSLLQFPAAAE